MSQNPLFIRTDNTIINAFIMLLKEKSFEKITVQDILERTPATRATFYAHYRDKYEIAEKMLEKYLESRKVMTGIDHNLIEALLKIHTEKVDLRRSVAQEFEKEYLEKNHGPYAAVEARMVAQAKTELEFAIYDNTVNVSYKEAKKILKNVALDLTHHEA